MCNKKTDLYLYFCHLIIIRNILCALPLLLRFLCTRILLLEGLRGVSLLWEKEELLRKGKRGRKDTVGRSWGYYVSARIFQLDFFRYSSVSWRPPGFWMGMKIITPAGQAHFPSAIIYRHPLDKVLVFGIQWKSESFRWKRGQRNNVCVFGVDILKSMFLRLKRAVIIDFTYC